MRITTGGEHSHIRGAGRPPAALAAAMYRDLPAEAVNMREVLWFLQGGWDAGSRSPAHEGWPAGVCRGSRGYAPPCCRQAVSQVPHVAARRLAHCTTTGASVQLMAD